jgi:hypothetical protein
LIDEEAPVCVHRVSSVPELNMAAEIDALIKNTCLCQELKSTFADQSAELQRLGKVFRLF